jgi:hypothetical protein
VLDALNLKTPDKVPFMFHNIDVKIRERILGEKLTYKYNTTTASYGPIYKPGEQSFLEPCESTDARVARKLGLDAIGMKYFPPLFVDVDKGSDGTVYIKKGLLTTPEALEKIKMPDVDDDRLYDLARKTVAMYKGEFAIFAKIRLGISPVLMSMGLEDFSYCLADDPDFVREVVKLYTEWVARLSKNLIECGVDFFWTADDMAYRTAPMFSTQVWDDIFAPYLKKAAESITVPWVLHSDGNLLPVMDRILDLGLNGLHPLEPGSMDLKELKANYGKKVCLVGNIDIDNTLTSGTLEDVDREVKNRIELLGPGGAYIISDSNSVPGYCKAENVIAMAKAVEKYRYIY